MIDTNIYDKIVADGLQDNISDLHQRGYVKIITTHIQLDEVSEIPDPNYREQLMSVEASCTRTAIGVWDLSKWDDCEWGNDAANSLFTALKVDNQKHVCDAIIGATAT